MCIFYILKLVFGLLGMHIIIDCMGKFSECWPNSVPRAIFEYIIQTKWRSNNNDDDDDIFCLVMLYIS